MISAINEVETAVRAMKLGAYHYITKDFEYDAVLSLVRNASDRTDLHRKVMSLSAQVADERERPFVTGFEPRDARGRSIWSARWPGSTPRCSSSARAARARSCSRG